MSKEGHIGVVSNTNKPINKMGPNQPILRRSETLIESNNQQGLMNFVNKNNGITTPSGSSSAQ